MLRVALTGGIACGKSAVARELEGLGVPVIDADGLARQVVAPGTPGFDAVVDRFGEAVLGVDGAIDRAALGRVVFADPRARADLESITHPRIAEASAAAFALLEEGGQPLAVYEAALIVEAGLADAFDLVVVVAARPEVQVRRMVARDGIDEVAARARIAAQGSIEDKVAVADLVIWNEGGLDELRARVAEVHRELVARGGG